MTKGVDKVCVLLGRVWTPQNGEWANMYRGAVGVHGFDYELVCLCLY